MRLNVGRYEQMASRAFSIKGPGALIELDTTALAVLQLDTNAPLEFWNLQRIHPFTINESAAAGGAGQFSGVQINNQDVDGVIVIESLYLRQTAAASNVAVYFSRTAGGTTFFGAPNVSWLSRDSRKANELAFPGSTGSVAVLPASPTWENLATIFTPNNTMYQRPLDLVMGPNSSLIVVCITANTALAMSVEGYRRDIEPGEIA